MKYEISQEKITVYPSPAYKNTTVGDFLDEYRQSSKNRYLLLLQGCILLDDVPVKDESEVIGERTLTILRRDGDIDRKPADEPCRVVYEDAFVYIVHKDRGRIIHGDENDTDCLSALAARWQLDHNLHVPVRPLHRLDRDTCGLVMFSKVPFFQPWLDEQMKDKKIQRHYLAICWNDKEPQQKFTCRQPIGKDRHRSGVYRVSKTGVTAVTKAELIAKKDPYALIGCTLETGRTHQIRVHLSERGLPIVNDPIYGRSTKQFKGMGLWADMIEFRSPLTNKKHKIHDIPERDYAYFDREE